MRASPARFDEAIDPAHDAARSIVLRYRNVFCFGEDAGQDSAFKALLARCSIAEGVRAFPLTEHRGVEIHVLDETSAMHSGTLKSIDGCVTVAHCLERGYGRIVFESGGNTGTALAVYARHAGIESFCFVPAENVGLLDGTSFGHPRTHLIAVEDPQAVRSVAEAFARNHAVPRVPIAEWRLAASRFIGCFVLEALLGGARFDWLAQSVSAGFAPLGIYQVLAEQGGLESSRPRFLGVQQAANCALFHAWQQASGADSRAARSAVPAAAPVHSTARLLTPVMYDSRPQSYGTFQAFANLLESSRGRVTTVDRDEFAACLGHHAVGRELLGRLADNGVVIMQRDGKVVERTGLMALVGVLKEIDAGAIAAGSRVLCCLTSGAGRPDGRAEPELHVRNLPELLRAAGERWFPVVANA